MSGRLGRSRWGRARRAALRSPHGMPQAISLIGPADLFAPLAKTAGIRFPSTPHREAGKLGSPRPFLPDATNDHPRSRQGVQLPLAPAKGAVFLAGGCGFSLDGAVKGER